MTKVSTSPTTTACFHCGQSTALGSFTCDERTFCCAGCKSVYQILQSANLGSYYTVDEQAGKKPTGHDPERFAYLDDPAITPRLLDYVDNVRARVTFSVPQIHCSACIWLLENLYRLEGGILRSSVDFLSRRLSVEYAVGKIQLSDIVALLARLGYEPDIRLDRIDAPPSKNPNTSLYIKIGVAGFSFANIMLFSFPEYLSSGKIGEEAISVLFRYANLLLSIPVLVYSASDYFKTAWAGLRQRTINLDFPIALGLCALFFRSGWDILTATGPGYFDSFTGLVLFLLAGKLFQRKTYQWLSFDRDYRAYFPIAVRRKRLDVDETVAVGLVGVGDRLIIRNQELIPADGIVMNGRAAVDYSFVTGESDPHELVVGDRVYAGGRQIGGSVEIEVIKSVDESYLVTLWSQGRSGGVASSSKIEKVLSTVTVGIGKYFTAAVLLIAAGTGWWWFVNDTTKWVHAFTSVLLVACPCAIALSSPFVFGSAMRLFGGRQLFLRHPDVVDALSRVDTVVFDKTGTLTQAVEKTPTFCGGDLSARDISAVVALARQSTHPASRLLAQISISLESSSVDGFNEIPGQGVAAKVQGRMIRFGRREFVTTDEPIHTTEADHTRETGAVHLSIDSEYRGEFRFTSVYRDGLTDELARLGKTYEMVVLTGDTRREEGRLRELFGSSATLVFDQLPHDKRNYIEKLRADGRRVLMLGDGLNDAGALGAADVGIAVTEDTSAFTPGCDGILHADRLTGLSQYLRASKAVRTVVFVSFGISIVYNIVGLSFAATGHLSPLVSAILMPVSSVSVVAFGTTASWLAARREGLA
jgi:Cu+-exporting ATPase